jgi:hypothetical protein
LVGVVGGVLCSRFVCCLSFFTCMYTFLYCLGSEELPCLFRYVHYYTPVIAQSGDGVSSLVVIRVFNGPSRWSIMLARGEALDGLSSL